MMVLDGTFHKTYEKSLLSNIPQNNIMHTLVNYNSIYFGLLFRSQESRLINTALLRMNHFACYTNNVCGKKLINKKKRKRV